MRNQQQYQHWIFEANDIHQLILDKPTKDRA